MFLRKIPSLINRVESSAKFWPENGEKLASTKIPIEQEGSYRLFLGGKESATFNRSVSYTGVPGRSSRLGNPSTMAN